MKKTSWYYPLTFPSNLLTYDMQLFTVGNPKTEKGESLGYQTHILHLAPADASGYEVCPGRSPECTMYCLNTAGRGRFDRTQNARIRKTVEFFLNRDKFLADMVKDIDAGIRLAGRRSLIPVFRPNGTSDVRWELYGIMQKYPHLQFYDYTKLSNRKNLPTNYHLTFSLSEDNLDKALEAFDNGMNVAAVFNVVPDEYLGREVIDGDEHDLRFLDKKNVWVGLKAKGEAKKADNGFVIHV